MTPEECRKEVEGWLELKLTSGRCSTLLAEQLAGHMAARTQDVFAIYDEIGGMEGAPLTRLRSTKPATPFTGPVLGGLWHKHYGTPAFLMRNLVNHWTEKRFSALITEVEADAAIPESNKGDRLAYRLVMEGYRQRSSDKRMTGEWIIFAKHQGANRYLTLANHTEGDEAILARAERAAAEFSGLAWADPVGDHGG